ncbi:endoglucanase [uncultured Methanobrevibacter sp.]|uniref:endoglucanase n=1 Tax=uncultured Methanobrevibacter sp. TaxID=253161 RepID=UPI00260D6D2B|nr:endoglucanase [uncultured Methanobrevibacter sp.]
MDKANIIISIIIVLCIAAAVAAYGITNSDSPIFSDLSSMSANSNAGNGLGNNTTHGNGTGHSVATTNGGASGSGAGDTSSGGAGAGTSEGSGSGYGGGSDYGGSSSSSSDSGSSSGTHLSYSTAQSIANSAVGEPGCYAGSVYYSGGYWYATIYDQDGNAVDSIGIDDATGSVSRM